MRYSYWRGAAGFVPQSNLRARDGVMPVAAAGPDHPVTSAGMTEESAPSFDSAFSSGPGVLAERMGVTVTEATPERIVGTMPVEGNTQPYGLLHGGASCVLAETLGSIGAALHGYTVGRAITVGIDINATHHKGAWGGIVTGVATPLHRGRSVASYEIVITDETGDRVCTARLTCVLRAGGATGPAGPVVPPDSGG
jgi:uncharacterized protein (TIGR00369 family)